MKIFLLIASVLILSTHLFGQSLTREQKFQRISELNAQIRALEAEFLAPSPFDIEQARVNGCEVFRLMPRTDFYDKLVTRGTGAFYSFTARSHDPQRGAGAQIQFSSDNLSVGFGGADYGFLFDLGDITLGSINGEMPIVAFLNSYRPPKKLSEIRKEQSKAFNYATEAGTLKDHVPALVGHTYVLRAISFDREDVLVALSIFRKDTDGSLIFFWRKIETFEKPIIDRDKVEN